MRGVTLHDATAAEIAAQAARETRSAARQSGVPLKVIKDWKEGMTQEERERVIGEQKLTEEQVATLDATAHARALAEAAGDQTLTLEEEVVEINRQIEKLGEADEDEAVQMLNAELQAEEEARSESPKAEEAARNEGDGAPRTEVPAEAKADAGGGEAAGRELDALRVRAAELDERLRAKGLRKAERAKISEELSGVQARMHELSGGNLVLFSRGEGAQGRPALSPTKAALRDRLLLKIAQTAGIRIVRERSAQILGSARNAEVRRRLGGYMGKAWSARANDALERGLRPAPMIAEELGVSSEAVELHMRSPEWHHVGDDYEEVHFYDPDEAPLTDADAVDDAETARSFLRYVEMLNYDTRTFTVKPRVAGRFESEASDEAYALFTSRGTAVAKEAFEAEDEFRALVEKETASAEELRAAAKATLAAAKSGRKKMEAAAKAFLSEHKDWKRERPRRARRGTNGLRYSLEEAFPATTEEREGIEREAKAKGTWLKAPNGNPSELTPEQWVTVRTRAFKEWFGDWEKAARIEKLRQASSVELKGYSGQYELTRDSARKWIKSNLEGKSYVIADTGETVRIGKAGRNKVTSHGYGNEAHMKSIADIPAMLENATFITEELAEKKDSKYPSYRYYVVGANIGETDYTVKIALGVAYDGTLYYDHSLTQIEKGALINLALAEQRRTQDFENALTGIKDNKLLSVLQVNSSKIVDGNGEPLVVYHGTDADFTVFDRAKTRATISSISSTVKNLEALVADYRAKGELDARQKLSSTGLNASSNPFAMIWTCSNMRLTIPSVFFRPKKSFR